MIKILTICVRESSDDLGRYSGEHVGDKSGIARINLSRLFVKHEHLGPLEEIGLAFPADVDGPGEGLGQPQSREGLSPDPLATLIREYLLSWWIVVIFNGIERKLVTLYIILLCQNSI